MMLTFQIQSYVELFVDLQPGSQNKRELPDFTLACFPFTKVGSLQK